MPATSMDSSVAFNTEVLMLLIGAGLGLLASVFTMIVQRWLDKKGKLNIFYRFDYQKGTNGRSWGFENSEDGRVYFTVPVVFEFQNTSNTTRVIRDVCLLLYNGKNQVGKMLQMDHLHVTNRRGREVTGEIDHYFGTDKGSYSFVIPPRSIQRQECEYMFIVDLTETQEKQFDTIIARYFDERNKAKTFTLRTMENSWAARLFPIDDEWQIFK